MKADPPTVDTRISQMVMDADKDFAAIKLRNVKQMAVGMNMGDILVHNGVGILVRLEPGAVIGSYLTTQSRTALPTWTAPP